MHPSYSKWDLNDVAIFIFMEVTIFQSRWYLCVSQAVKGLRGYIRFGTGNLGHICDFFWAIWNNLLETRITGIHSTYSYEKKEWSNMKKYWKL